MRDAALLFSARLHYAVPMGEPAVEDDAQVQKAVRPGAHGLFRVPGK
jgi:hypothetical protein